MDQQPDTRAEVFGQRMAENRRAARHLAIAETPFCGMVDEEAGYVARFFPAPHHPGRPLTLESAETLIDESTLHFDVLRSQGIEVPATFSMTGQSEKGGVLIYSLSEYVDGEPLTAPNTWTDRPDDINQLQALKLAESLLGYMAWIWEAKPPRYLSDVFGVHQYLRRADGRNVYVDTDPLMCTASNSSLMIDVRHVTSWVNEIKIEPEQKQKILDKLHKLHALLWQEPY